MEEKIKTVEELLTEKMTEIIGILNIPITESNIDTPKRVAKMFLNELFVNRPTNTLDGVSNLNFGKLIDSMTFFDNPDCSSNEPIEIKGIKFNSMCEHHLLPMKGKVDISYIPSTKVLGLSKFPRAVKYFSRRPQLQERFTKELGEFLAGMLRPIKLTVRVYDVEHSCVTMRGIEAECSTDTRYHYEGA